MKRILLVLFSCATFSTINSQIQPSSSTPVISAYTAGVDTKLQLLNKNFVTTHILYDRVYPMASLSSFNKTSSDTSNVNHFYHAYAELQNADYSKRWNSISYLKAQVENHAQNTIPIGIINVDYEILDERAIVDNLLDIIGTDSLLIDVSNRPRSPYIKKNALVASPLAEKTNGKTVTFVTNNTYKLLAANKNISSIQVDFRNGQGYQSLPTTGTKTVTFSNVGLYHLKFKVQFTDNSIKYTYASLEVKNAKPVLTEYEMQNVNFSCAFNSEIEIYSSRKFQGYNETNSYSSKGEYKIYPGGAYFDNPVIVLDGFDPDEGTEKGNNASDVYNQLLKFNENNNLGLELRLEDFDIVPLNFMLYEAPDGKTINGGSDYIERNAMVLIDLIEGINACKVGNEPIKIIGFSMGGLVARYALRYMEINNIPHNTDLFVSVDTPHKGAVVPIGVQETADVLDDIVPFGLGNPADDILLTPAAKQMLVHHYLAHSKPPVGAPSFHDRFYNDLDAMGFPQQTRNVAVVNGMSNGTPINNPGQRFLNGHLNPGDPFIQTGTDWQAKLYYAPNRGQTKNALDFRIKLKFIFFNITIYKRIRQTTTISSLGSYENPPGGFYNTERLVTNFLNKNKTQRTLRKILEQFVFQINTNGANFSFIPVKSSLAYSGSNPDLYEDFSNRDLVCTDETPFDSYFTATTENQEHIDLFTDSANFIIQEILGNTQLPNVDPTVDYLQGPDKMCFSNATYLLENCHNLPVTWSRSNNLQLINETNTSITVKPNASSTSGLGFVQAEFGNRIERKELWIGSPNFNFVFDWDEAARRVTVTAVGLSGSDISLQEITNMNWERVSSSGGGFVPGGSCSGYSCTARGPFNSINWSVDFKVTASNTYGTVIKYITATPPPPLASKGTGFYDFVSNPNYIYTINYIEEDISTPVEDFEHQQSDFNISVYNFSGNKVMETSETRIDISQLKSGIYILKAIVNNDILTKKVIK